MDRQPLVSVCINCYNAENTIADTVASVLAQTYSHLQVIVVDDCSTDASWSILQGFRDPRLELVRLPENEHIAGANNEALRRVRGDYVAHLDADDTWMPTKIEKQLAFMQAHPEYGACFTLAEMVDEHGNRVDDHRYRAENRPSHELFCHLVTHGNYLCHCAMFARKSVIDAVGEHDRTLLYYHDFDYWIRMSTVCEIYILAEELVRCRLSSTSNSHFTPEKENAHTNEWAHLVYHAVTACPDDIFLKAFAHRLRRTGDHTAEQTALEKAFVLLDLFAHRRQNRAMGLRRLHELMRDPVYVQTAKRDFGFTVHDLYALNQSAVYHDEAAAQEAGQVPHADVRAQLDEARAQNAALTAELHAALAAHEAAAAQLQHIAASKSWKLTAPLRLAQVARRIAKTAKHPKTRDGRAAKAVVVLYGYFGHNLGDDLFFDTLFRRYPDTVFVVYDANDYRVFFDRYQNVYSYERTEPHAAKIDRLGAKVHIDDAFERLLLHYADAVIHVGGSIYQQVRDWERDLQMRKKRYKRTRPFFSISSNFGPYHTVDYAEFWKRQFRKSLDICMRDTYSHGLFADVSAVRYAPDLLFAHPMPAVEPIADRLFISVNHPLSANGAYTEDQHNAYVRSLIALIKQWTNDGGTVCLSSFCAFEHDDDTVAAILAAVPDGVTAVNYHGDGRFAPVLTAIASSEYVLATRFHAMVLGLAAGKRVLPVAYSQKLTHVLDDLHFAGDVTDILRLGDTDAAALVAALRAQPPHDVTATVAAAAKQLERLDAYIESKNGTVVR
ncbi:MAG: glycosyltransferase [Clostridia bacterium]|nr:glycosyltransferase [Clostridia bacterium]